MFSVSEGFVSSPLDGQGASHKDSYYPMSDENAAELRDTDAEFCRLKGDFLWIAQNRRRRGLSRSDSSRSSSPVRRQPPRRSANQMPPSVCAHLATQQDSASLENLAMLADRAVATEKDVDEAKPGVAEINVSESGKLVGLLEDLSRRLKKLETATAKATKKKTYGHSHPTENQAAKTQFIPNVQAKPFMPNNQAITRQDVSNNNKKDSRPNAPPPQTPQNNVAQPTETATAQVCYYHQTFSGKARLCSEPCSYYSTLGQREVANIALSSSKFLYVADKQNKCNYLIDTGAAVSVLPKSCTNRTSDAACLPLVAANNTTINTYGNCRHVVDVGLKRDYKWTFIVADVKQPIIGADFLIHYSLLVDLKNRCLRDMCTGLAIPATLSSIKPLSLNRVDTVQNDYTKLLGQFPELTRPTTKQQKATQYSRAHDVWELIN